MNARPNLRLVDGDGELQGEVCPGCVELTKRVSVLAGENTRLKNEEAERLGLAPDAKDIMVVLRYHKRILSPRARIVRAGPAWKNVKARLGDTDAETGERAFTVQHLEAAVVGLWVDDWKGRKKITAAAWLFENPDRVQQFVDVCVTFKRDTGVSALSIVDELGRGGLERLAERCECGHLRLDHERENPAEGLWDPVCAVHGCACEGYATSLDCRVERFMAERDRVA